MRITVKVGSNVLTRADGSLDVTRMSALVDQVAELRQRGVEVLMVSSGAVAAGRSELQGLDASRMDAVEQRQLYSAVGQAKLINRYYELFRDHGMAVGQVLSTKESFGTRRHYLNQRACMNALLDRGVIPVINENDTVSVTELMFTDNDELSGLVAAMMDCDALIILSNIDGIFTAHPDDPSAQLIRSVEPGRDLSDYISAERSGFGRGGMQTKSHIAQKVALEGIDVVIANGKRDGILTALVDELEQLRQGMPDHAAQVPFTRFVPSHEETSSVKRWIAHSEGFAKGAVHLDANATERLLGDEAVSILPVGITQVDGSFERHDIISIIAADGSLIGVGRTDYGDEEARAVVGRHGQRPIVHYDYLCLNP
jgi:glutamate 5-kinase